MYLHTGDLPDFTHTRDASRSLGQGGGHGDVDFPPRLCFLIPNTDLLNGLGYLLSTNPQATFNKELYSLLSHSPSIYLLTVGGLSDQTSVHADTLRHLNLNVCFSLFALTFNMKIFKLCCKKKVEIFFTVSKKNTNSFLFFLWCNIKLFILSATMSNQGLNALINHTFYVLSVLVVKGSVHVQLYVFTGAAGSLRVDSLSALRSQSVCFDSSVSSDHNLTCEVAVFV